MAGLNVCEQKIQTERKDSEMSVADTEKDIKKLSRTELVDVIYQLKKSEQKLEEQVQTLQAALDEKNLRMENVGSVAEASLALTDIFANAQTAADAYLEEIRTRRAAVEEECSRLSAEAQEKADTLLRESTEQAEKTLQDAQTEADSVLQEAQTKADAALQEAQEKADAILQDAHAQASSILQDAQTRKETIDSHCRTTRSELQRVQETLRLLNDAIPTIIGAEDENAEAEEE